MTWDWDWDTDWHHDHHYWHWRRFLPWDYHLKCRRFLWGFGAPDFDVCARDWHHHPTDPAWCHRSCLASKVFIETGEESDSSGKGTFKVIIDVHHFRANELTVKVKNNDIIILEGKQKDGRADMATFCITREFTRKYRLPRNYDGNQAKVTLSNDGILTVMVPAPPALDDVERYLEIVETGAYFGSSSNSRNSKKDAKAIENGENGENGGGGEDDK